VCVWRMTSTKPDQQLPSQPQSTLTLWPVPCILLCDRGSCLWVACQGPNSPARRVRLKPATSRSWVWHSNHYTIEPRWYKCNNEICKVGNKTLAARYKTVKHPTKRSSNVIFAADCFTDSNSQHSTTRISFNHFFSSFYQMKRIHW